jgi:Surface antigen
MKLIKVFLIALFSIVFIVCLSFMMVMGNASDSTSNDNNYTHTDDTTISNTKFDINLPSYKSNNPFYPRLNGQCTWYAWGRANQLFGITNLPTGNAKEWLSLASQKGFRTGLDPAKNSIVVFAGTTYGHVAYIENWDGTYITVSEANTNWHGYVPPAGVGTYASDETVLLHMRIKTYEYKEFVSKFAISNLKILGYIYLP